MTQHCLHSASLQLHIQIICLSAEQQWENLFFALRWPGELHEVAELGPEELQLLFLQSANVQIKPKKNSRL